MMERLTAYNTDGQPYIIETAGAAQAVAKLASYEDSGVRPDDIRSGARSMVHMAGELEALKKKLEEAETLHKYDSDRADKAEEKNKALHQTNYELREKIKFLEGQIEAYQYCMNCRR